MAEECTVHKKRWEFEEIRQCLFLHLEGCPLALLRHLRRLMIRLASDIDCKGWWFDRIRDCRFRPTTLIY